MTCNHGNRAPACMECYRDLAADRGRRILSLGSQLAAAQERVRELEWELAQAANKRAAQ